MACFPFCCLISKASFLLSNFSNINLAESESRTAVIPFLADGKAGWSDGGFPEVCIVCCLISFGIVFFYGTSFWR